MNSAIQNLIDDQEDDPFERRNFHGARVAEKGLLSPRKTTFFKKWQSSLVLKQQRLAVFSSPEHRNAVMDLGIRESNSPLSMIRTAIDPSYREQTLGDRWRYVEGCSDKNDAPAKFVPETPRKVEGSKLKNVTLRRVSSEVKLRRSKRLQAKSQKSNKL